MQDLRVIVSRRCEVEGLRPGYVCRDEPLNEEDSGWQILVGDETAEELDDPENALLEPLATVLARWPELRPVLEIGEGGGEWRWDSATGAYVPLVR